MDSLVTSERIEAYSGLVEGLARRITGYAGAEYDDLVQEGNIAVWQTLARGLRPSRQVIRGRMIDWTRYLRRLTNNDAIAYEQLLPIDSFDDQLR